MIKKIIIFSDNQNQTIFPIKSASNLRATYMLRKLGYEVKQIHHCLSFTDKEIETILDNFSNGDQVLVGISTSFLIRNRGSNTGETGFWGGSAYKFMLTLALFAKKRKFPIMVGGWEISKNRIDNLDKVPDLKIEELQNVVDYFVVGNDLIVVDQICKNNYTPYKEFGKAKIIVAPQIVDFRDCASTPTLNDGIQIDESLSTEVAAGCIFSCSFCNYAALGKKKTDYVRSYESLERELISNYENFKTRVYTFTDNIINDFDEKLKYLIKIRDKTGIDIRWVSYVRLDTIKNKDQVKLMKDAGLAGALFGIESLKAETGPYIGKMTDKNKIMKCIEMFRNVVGDSVLTTGLFIAGLPGETYDELIDTYTWLTSDEGKHYFDTFYFNALNINPNIIIDNIKAARKNPFRDYKMTGDDWVSPWGNKKTFDKLANIFIRNNTKNFAGWGGSFILPAIHNSGLKIEDAINKLRNDKFELLTNTSKNDFIMKYKQNVLQ